MADLFHTNPEKLGDLLKEVDDGSIQLPDFQRGWVWDEIRIKNLLISVISNFPIGAVMMLDAENDNAKFCSVVLRNVVPTEIPPKRLLLDGQQRLTSLYQTLKYQKEVDTTDVKNKKKILKRFYYFNINEMIKDDFDEDEVIFIANEKKYRKQTGIIAGYDLTSTRHECNQDLFPTNLSLDIPEALKWSMVYTDNGRDVPKQQKWNKFFTRIVLLSSYSIPVISLTKENKKEAVCSVFENVNTGGVPLNVFELLTATFAADNFRLRQDWEERIEPELKKESKDYSAILSDVSNVDFLQSLTLLATYRRAGQAVACKRKNILDLKLDEYKALCDTVKNGYIEAAKFLIEQHIYSESLLPYGSQLVPLAAIFAESGSKANIAKNAKKIARWYWCGVFGELYGGANETRFVKDFTDVSKWINDDDADLPDTVRVSSFRADRLDEMRTKLSAAYKGVSILLLKAGAKDFIKDCLIDSISKYNSESIDIHHVFPYDYCNRVGIASNRRDSIINKAPLSYDTNRKIGGNAPSVYIAKFLDSENGDEITNSLLLSQRIDVDAIRNDDFDTYYRKRKASLISLIEQATGNTVTGKDGEEDLQ